MGFKSTPPEPDVDAAIVRRLREVLKQHLTCADANQANHPVLANEMRQIADVLRGILNGQT